MVPVKGVILRDPDLVKLAGLAISDPERVKVIILPPHRVLDRDMQIPKGIASRYLNPSPNRWINPFEGHPELK